ncbi:MAG: N-acetylmuramoyl-L-alanine amidase [Pseudomonadota bacterium]
MASKKEWLLRLTVVALALGCTHAAAVDIDGLRVWEGPDKTRAVLDLDGPVDYRVFTLRNPDRVVVDIEDVVLPEGIAPPASDGKLIAGVRTGKRNGDGLRVVFDLKATTRPKSFLLPPVEPYGHRLVIDLHPQGTAAPAPTKQASEVQAQDRDIVIAIDAGHGGEDPGAIGPSGTYEKDVVLAVSKDLDVMLDALPGFRGELVRTGDYYIPHFDRHEKARQFGADLFISVHADGFYDRRARGSSVFVLSNRRATSEAAKWLADRENRSDLVGGVKLDDKDDMLAAVLLDLSQSAVKDASYEAADAVFKSISRIGNTHKKRVEAASFAVLTSPDIPSMLVETAFITNPEEEKRLKTRRFQKLVAQAIADGVVDYFAESSPPGTYVAKHGVERNQHIVSRGETLSGIAARHRVTLARLRAANSIDGDLVRAGDVLTIPAG